MLKFMEVVNTVEVTRSSSGDGGSVSSSVKREDDECIVSTLIGCIIKYFLVTS